MRYGEGYMHKPLHAYSQHTGRECDTHILEANLTSYQQSMYFTGTKLRSSVLLSIKIFNWM